MTTTSSYVGYQNNSTISSFSVNDAQSKSVRRIVIGERLLNAHNK